MHPPMLSLDAPLTLAGGNNRADLLHATGRQGEAMDELKRAVTIFAEIGAEGPRPEVWKLARW